MAQDRALSDSELQAIFENPKADLSLLSADEHARLLALTDPAPTPVAAAPKPSDSGALLLRGLPLAQRGLDELATNPAVPKLAATAGRVIGGVAPIVGGYEAAGVPGALMGVGAAAKGSWAGGKAGWFTGKLAQSMAGPPARALGRLAPLANPLQVAQGGLDLAQMAEPNRKDIGFLGIGATPAPPASPNYGKRWDEKTQSNSGPPKGDGFLGPLVIQTPNGPGVASEYSRDGEINGKPTQYPLIVPTLTKEELALVLKAAASENPPPLPASIERKAAAHATQRLAAGQDVFAGPGEQQTTLYPDLQRAAPPPDDHPPVLNALYDAIRRRLRGE